MKMKVIIPKKLLFDTNTISRAIENALDGAAKSVEVDLDVTTQTWTHKVAFRIAKSLGKREISTDDEIYHYVNDGTRPHIIRATTAKVLAFGTPSRPKTRVKAIGSTNGSTGPVTVFRKQVKHPGTEAREFTTVIADKWQQELPRILQRAIDSEV